MTTFEVVLTVAGTVVALLLFTLEVHGRKMEHRSRRERIGLAVLALVMTGVIAAAIVQAHRGSVAAGETSDGSAPASPSQASPTGTALTATHNNSTATSAPSRSGNHRPTKKQRAVVASERKTTSEQAPTVRVASEPTPEPQPGMVPAPQRSAPVPQHLPDGSYVGRLVEAPNGKVCVQGDSGTTCADLVSATKFIDPKQPYPVYNPAYYYRGAKVTMEVRDGDALSITIR